MATVDLRLHITPDVCVPIYILSDQRVRVKALGKHIYVAYIYIYTFRVLQTSEDLAEGFSGIQHPDKKINLMYT